MSSNIIRIALFVEVTSSYCSFLKISFEMTDYEPVYTHFGAQEGADVCPASNQRVLTTLNGIYAR